MNQDKKEMQEHGINERIGNSEIKIKNNKKAKATKGTEKFVIEGKVICKTGQCRNGNRSDAKHNDRALVTIANAKLIVTKYMYF